MVFETELKVRFRDLDAMGHVNNAAYFTFMEQARTEYYMRFAKARRVDEIEFILASAKCDFKAPIPWGETVVVSAWPTRIGQSSFSLAYELRSKATGTLFATGESVQVAYDYGAKKPKPIPGELRKALEAEVGPPAPTSL